MSVIGVLSGKGGVGKTTIVSNLCAAISRDFGRDVLLIDSNLKTSHLGLHLGLYEEPSVTLHDVISKKVPISRAVLTHQKTGIKIIPSPLNSKKTNMLKLKSAVGKMKKEHEIVFVDCAPGLGKDVVTAIKAVDRAIIVTTPDVPSVNDAIKTIDLLEKMRKEVIGIVVNRVRDRNFELSPEEIESVSNKRILAVVPEDSRVAESIAKGIPLVAYRPHSRAAVPIRKLGAHLIGEFYEERRVHGNIFSLMLSGLKDRLYGKSN